MDNIDRKIINQLQNGFPICASPYQYVAKQLDMTETELLERLKKLISEQILTRFGPMYHAERMGGAITLAAIKVPEDEWDRIAAMINTHPEVAHNYARRHKFNMWFVLAAESAERIQQVIESIEHETGLCVYNMPKIKEYFVGLKLDAT